MLTNAVARAQSIAVKQRGLLGMTVVAAGTAVLVVLASGCGSPSEVREFRFTPVPYTLVPWPNGTVVPVAGTEADGVYRADELIVSVRNDRLGQVEEFLDSYGFEHQRIGSLQATSTTYLLVRVPVGGALAARSLLRDQDSVVSADLNFIRFAD